MAISSNLFRFNTIKEVVEATFSGQLEPSLYTAINTDTDKEIQIFVNKDVVTVKEQNSKGWYEVQVYYSDGTVENLVENH